MNADIRPIRTAAESSLGDIFAAAREELPGGEAALRVRDEAFAVVGRKGLPNRRVEDWKYTDLRALMREARPLADTPGADEVEAARALLPFGEVAARRVVFVNGRLSPDLSDMDTLEEGLSIAPLAVALAGDAVSALALKGVPNDNAVVALNTAFAADGLVIAVSDGAKIDRPIHVANIQTGAAHASYGRVLVSVGKGGSITLIESHVGDSGAHQTNTLIGLDIADGASAKVLKLQDEGLGTLHLATLAARLGAKAFFESVSLATGSSAARQQIYLDFAGDKAKAEVFGAGLAGGKRHLDTTLVIDHRTLGCSSRELFKTALDGEARSVFQGRITVRPGAQKTDGKMMANALLLSETAEADAKPELEIFADDVVCGHGATVGAIDDELLFYLMARGIPKAEAEGLLVQAFVGEALESVDDDALRDALSARAERWLSERV
ncbi:Fe-S cluster assembly protein SufD [Chenggangzhangella methanolivorans]|uniref:Fe-S cluster assembly protein SufD n=1 Tax=Chenggangzhangella methanolivorans TaxID=1437009 RepID=UPI00361E55CD